MINFLDSNSYDIDQALEVENLKKEDYQKYAKDWVDHQTEQS